MTRLSVHMAGFIFALLSLTSPASAKKIALVIGNDRYTNVQTLQKAVADASGYAQVLRDKGFGVTERANLGRAGLDETIASFVEHIEPDDTAVFVYAGHGWSDGAQNYLLGVDAPATGSPELFARISIPLKNGNNGVLDDMERKGASLKVAIIDACRDNPFSPPLGQRGVGLARGLAPMQAPAGTFVVFSAGAHQSALDRLSDLDRDPNSVFTRVFLPMLRSDLTLQEAIKEAQQKVVDLARTANTDQRPAYYDEVIGKACLSEQCKTSASPSAVVTTPVTASPDQIAWEFVKMSTDVAQVQSFINLYPNSLLRSQAEALLAKLREPRQPASGPVATVPTPPAFAPAPPVGQSLPARRRPLVKQASISRPKPSLPAKPAAPTPKCFIFNGERQC